MKFLLALLAIIVLSSFIIAKTGYITKKTPGSFEYVRKAETFLDKGKYPEAIELFAKAYGTSPDNTIIQDNLIYAYSRYAQVLSNSGKYDDAVRLMVKAYEISQNTDTMQNLALTYAKKALAEAGRQEWSDAADSLMKARLAAEDSDKASRALSILLHNDALEEFKAGRDTTAILLLKEALLAREDSHLYTLLGDIYYKKSDLSAAEFYFSKATKVDPESKDAAERLRKVTEEVNLSKAKSVRKLPHFEIRHERDIPIDIDFVGSVLEKAYVDVGGDLDYYPDARTIVFFYTAKNFRDIFKAPEIVRAFYDGNIRIPLPAKATDKKELSSYLYHEYTHAALSARTSNNCPAWLGEGIAVWEEVKWTRPDAVINLTDKVMEGRYIALQSLEDAFKGNATEKADIALYYLLAYTMVEYMVDTWGLPGLRDILSRVAEGQHTVNAMDDVFLISEKEFDRRWRGFIERKYLKKRRDS